jgi:dTMP kinase
MPYYIFEGPDGVGKSTAILNVINSLKYKGEKREFITTQLPGTTPLGKHIRKLVKNPESIDEEISMNPLTRQILYAADYSSFVIDYLTPLLAPDKIIICDRCSAISSRIYGDAENIDITMLDTLYGIIPSPKADAIFVLNCGPQTSIDRMASERPIDYYDKLPLEFKQKVHKSYHKLTTVGTSLNLHSQYLAHRIVSIDASQDAATVSSKICDIINSTSEQS